MKKFIIVTAIAAAVIAAYILVPRTEHATRSQAQTVLKAGTTADFPPFAFYQQGTIVGFDIDLINAVGNKLGMPVEITDLPFDLLITDLQLGKINVISAGLTATPERAKRVLFTTPHLTGDKLAIVHYANGPKIATVQDLVGKEAAVNEGYTADTFMSAINGIHLLRLTSLADALLALQHGKVVAFVTATNTIQQLQGGTHGLVITPIEDSAENTALAVALGQPELHGDINRALDELKADGTIDALKAKWKLA